MNIIQQLEKEQFDKLSAGKTIPEFGPGDTVIFSWIVFESRAHRDRVNAAVMADPRIQSLDVEHMPFDCRRMAYGGFVPIVPA